MSQSASAEMPDSGSTEDGLLALLASLEASGAPLQDPAFAIDAYQQWIDRNAAVSPGLFAAWFNLGVELGHAGDKDGAMAAYQAVLAQRPDFHPAAVNLGLNLESRGHLEAALAVWQQALQPEDVRDRLRQEIATATQVARQPRATVLTLRGMPDAPEPLPAAFRNAGWRETRLESGAAELQGIADATAEAVFAPGTLSYLHPHEAEAALQHIRRVLKPDGVAVVAVPDLQELARHIADGKLADPFYISQHGPCAPLDILFGDRRLLAAGHAAAARHTGFTGETLAAALIRAGFAAAMVQCDPAACSLTAVAFSSAPRAEQRARAQAQMLPAHDRPAAIYTATA